MNKNRNRSLTKPMINKQTIVKYSQPSLLSVMFQEEQAPISQAIATRITLGKGFFNRYRIIVYRPSDPSPFPGGLDYQFYFEAKNAPGQRPKRVWKVIDPGHLARVTSKLFRLAAKMMLGEAEKDNYTGICDLDGVPIPKEYELICRRIQSCGGLDGWRDLLINELHAVQDSWSLLRFGGGIGFSVNRFTIAHGALSAAGYSDVEINCLMSSYTTDAGLDLKHNSFARYLQAVQPPRYRILQFIQVSLCYRNLYKPTPEEAVTAIIDLIPNSLIEDIIRADRTLRWTPLNFQAPNEKDIEWELIHGKSVPGVVLAQFPDLVVRFGVDS